jgi:hypothetical protein
MFFLKLRQLKKQARSLRLTQEEKQLMHNNISAFMKEHPVRKNVDVRQVHHKTEPSSVFSFLQRKYMFATLASIIIVLLSGGVSYAAEGSIPGQPLYSVKHINEEVRSALTLSPEKKADWNAKRVERRLEEATTLASTGKLTTSTQAMLSSALEENMKKVEEKLHDLESKGHSEKASEVAKRLEHALALHEKLLESIGEKQNLVVTTSPTSTTTLSTTTSTSSTLHSDRYDKENDIEVGDDKNQSHKNALVRDIRHQTNEILKIANKLEKTIDAEQKNQSAAEGKITAAKNKIDEAQKFIDLKSSHISPESKAKALASIALASTELTSAQTSLAAQKYTESFDHAKKAQFLAEDAKRIVSTQEKIQKNINVGKVLSELEKKEDEKRARILSSTSTLRSQNTSTTTPSIAPKALEKRIENKKEHIEKIGNVIEKKIENEKERIQKIEQKIQKEVEKKQETLQKVKTKIENLQQEKN